MLSGDIDVQQGKTFTAESNLSLFAHRNIQVSSGAHIVNEGTGDIYMFAGWNDASGTSPTFATVNSGVGDLTVNANISTLGEIFLQAGNDVNINNALISSAGPAAGYAHVGVNAFGGNLTINNSTVRARGGNSTFDDGGWGELDIWADNGTLSILNNSLIEGIGGDSSAASYGGGNSNLFIDAGVININGSQVIATGGNATGVGGSGGSAYIGVDSTGLLQITNSSLMVTGGNGVNPVDAGSAAVDIAAFGLAVTGSQLKALSGNNGGGGSASISIDGGEGNALSINSSTLESKGNSSANIDIFGIAPGTVAGLQDSTFAASADGGDGYISVLSYGAVDFSTSTLTSTGPSGVVDIYADQGVTLGLINSSQIVYVYSGNGALVDGNTGLNISAPQISLFGDGGVGTIANPLETQAGQLYVEADSGEIGIINSGNLMLSGAYSNTANIAVGATGDLTVEGGEGSVDSGGSLMLGANGNLNVLDSIYSSGPMTLQAGGNVTVGGPSSYSFAEAYSGSTLTIVAGGDLNVLPNYYGYPSTVWANDITTVITGGNVLVDQSTIYGSPDVFMQVGGLININGTLAYGGKIEASSLNTINVNFTSASGGFAVNGTTGLVYDPATNTGFFVNGSPASLGNGLSIIYSGTEAPPVSTLTIPTENLIVAMGESSKPPDPEQDKDVFEDVEEKKKKEAPVCR